MNGKVLPAIERREWNDRANISTPHNEAFRWVAGLHLLALGSTMLLLPQPQFVHWVFPSWFFGGLIALGGFGLLWLTVLTLPKTVVVGLSVLIALPLLVAAIAYWQTGVAQGTALLVCYICGILWTAFTTGWASRSPYRWTGQPRPDVLGVVLGTASTLQGAVLMLLPAAQATFATPFGIAPATTGIIWLVTGLAVVGVQFIPRPPSWLRWTAHVAGGMALLGFWVAVSVALTPTYWITGLTLTVRGAGTIFVPWWSGREGRFDASSLRPRLVLALFTAAVMPVLVAVAVLVNGLDLNTPDLTDERYAAYILMLVTALGAGAGTWWYTGKLLVPLRMLVSTVQRIARAEYNLATTPFDTSELETMRTTIGDMARTIQARTQENAKLLATEQQARRQAEAANRLKIEFLAMISHELRTPLTSIKGYVSTLLATDVTWTAAQQRQFLVIADEEADKLTELIEQLLNLTRLQAGSLPIKPGRTTLTAIIEGASPQIRALTRAHQLQLDGIEAAPPVVADPLRIGQVMVNLIGNAAKFSPPGSPIVVSAHSDQQFVRVDVCDQGIGISPDAHLYVFEAFRQADGLGRQQSKGAGLGLAICKGLVEAHGGRIWVQDQPNRGTTISFTLPTA